jgi:triosephosphate isomerase
MDRRVPVIVGNWKMNLDLDQALELVNGIKYGLPYPGEVDVVVAPTFLWLPRLAEHLRDSYIGVAAQNLHFEDQGAATGECSAGQIKAAGADYVIVGHSERRQHFGETDEIVNKKVKAALRSGLTPIVCVGETLAERQAGEVSYVIGKQVSVGLGDLTHREVGQIMIAYEPVWAIGTGHTAAADQVEAVHGSIRFLLTSKFGGPAAGSVRLLYGGSVKPANSRELLACADVDGALVGGASLQAADFIDIIKSVNP